MTQHLCKKWISHTNSFQGLLSKVSVAEEISYVFSGKFGAIFIYADGSVRGADRLLAQLLI